MAASKKNKDERFFQDYRSYKESLKIFKCGFTLIELLVVIAVIALLISILMPSLSNARSMAMRVKCSHNLKQLSLAFQLYIDEYNDKYPCAQDPVMPNPDPAAAWDIWLWMGRGWRPVVEPYVGTTSGVRSSSVLLCPQDSTDPNMYDDTSYAYSLSFYHSPAQINTVTTIGQQLWIVLNPSVPQKSTKVSRPANKIMIGEWLSNHKPTDGDDGGWWCHTGGRNFLFADSHVDNIKAEDIQPANDGYPNPNVTKDGIRGFDWPG
jgi:prepilin-type N-terminal cleavage/methylation domain-containing protein/prepilin-type processing-associated H-X9-DG protein